MPEDGIMQDDIECPILPSEQLVDITCEHDHAGEIDQMMGNDDPEDLENAEVLSVSKSMLEDTLHATFEWMMPQIVEKAWGKLKAQETTGSL